MDDLDPEAMFTLPGVHFSLDSIGVPLAESCDLFFEIAEMLVSPCQLYPGTPFIHQLPQEL